MGKAFKIIAAAIMSVVIGFAGLTAFAIYKSATYDEEAASDRSKSESEAKERALFGDDFYFTYYTIGNGKGMDSLTKAYDVVDRMIFIHAKPSEINRDNVVKHASKRYSEIVAWYEKHNRAIGIDRDNMRWRLEMEFGEEMGEVFDARTLTVEIYEKAIGDIVARRVFMNEVFGKE